MKDCREKLLNELQILVQTSDRTNLSLVSDRIIKIISQYEIIERSTEIVPVDTSNAKIINQYGACLKIGGKSEKNYLSVYKTVQESTRSNR